MDSVYFTALDNYYKNLEKFGYRKYTDVFKILVLRFYKTFIFENLERAIPEDDYRLIEKALECVFGTSCLIPYQCYVMDKNIVNTQLSQLIKRVEQIEAKVEEIPDNIVVYQESSENK